MGQLCYSRSARTPKRTPKREYCSDSAHMLPRMTWEKSRSGKCQLKIRESVVFAPAFSSVDTDTAPCAASPFCTREPVGNKPCSANVLNKTFGSFALAKEAVTVPDESKTGRSVMSPIDGPAARGRVLRVRPPSLSSQPSFDLIPHHDPTRCVVSGTSWLSTQDEVLAVNCQEAQLEELSQDFMHVMWVVAEGILVEFAEARLQSVQAPIGRLNMNDAFCAVVAVFSTASVSTTAGNADACACIRIVVSAQQVLLARRKVAALNKSNVIEKDGYKRESWGTLHLEIGWL